MADRGGYIVARPRRRRSTVFLALVAPALLSAGLLVASAVPAQAIDVVANGLSPVPGEQEVAVNANVRVTFDVPARGVNANTFPDADRWSPGARNGHR